MRDTLEFLLYDWIACQQLCERPRFAEHSRETFSQVLDTCERIARERYAPFNRLVDEVEPRMENGSVVLPQASHDAWQAYVQSGMLAAAQDAEYGGMQLPCVVETAANACFAKASVGIGATMLTSANAGLLLAHGSAAQREVFARREFAGEWAGTMCLSEPQAGSGLGDIVTRALPDGDDWEGDPLGPRYRLFGTKMWISAGEHELSSNIVHLVLAKIPDAQGRLPPGTRGISLFVVPKWLPPEAQADAGARNDIVLAGLNHKLGWRGTPNTLLNFGEGGHPVGGRAGAVGWRVGEPGAGLRCMFHMMNEARIAVGMAAAMLGMAGYEASLEYARQRRQGRAAGRQDEPQALPIIEHADVRRMLLAQKAYAEGGLALSLFCARLVDETHTAEPEAAASAQALLDLLTPVAKSWPSQWCLEANSLAIQVHGGYGYTRDFPVEQYWRDNRLNMIHEGTHGIQAQDLLGRKVLHDQAGALRELLARMHDTAQRAEHAAEHSDQALPWRAWADALRQACATVGQAAQAAAQQAPQHVLDHATPFLQGFGHVVLAWIWLDLALCARKASDAPDSRQELLLGKLAACRYFFAFELPLAQAWLQPLLRADATLRETPQEWL